MIDTNPWRIVFGLPQSTEKLGGRCQLCGAKLKGYESQADCGCVDDDGPYRIRSISEDEVIHNYGDQWWQ